MITALSSDTTPSEIFSTLQPGQFVSILRQDVINPSFEKADANPKEEIVITIKSLKLDLMPRNKFQFRWLVESITGLIAEYFFTFDTEVANPALGPSSLEESLLLEVILGPVPPPPSTL